MKTHTTYRNAPGKVSKHLRSIYGTLLIAVTVITVSLPRQAWAEPTSHQLPGDKSPAGVARSSNSNKGDHRTWDADIPASKMLHRGTPLFDHVKTVLIRIIYYPVAYNDDGQELIPAALRRDALQQMMTTAYKERFNDDPVTIAKAHDNHWPLYGRTNPTFILYDEKSRSSYIQLIKQPDTLTAVLQVTCESAPNPDVIHPAKEFVLNLFNYRPANLATPFEFLTKPISKKTQAPKTELTSQLHEYINASLNR